MPSCSTSVCGVGGWGGPLPGDPSNDVILTAVGVYGGIDVRWTYPTTNPWAVSYVVVYRGTSSDPATAIEVGKVGGNFFHDQLPVAATSYYWIQVFSINGTPLAWVGPASALSKLTITGIIEELTGMIDQGLLANVLKTEIDKIPLLQLDLANEITERLASNASLQALLTEVQDNVDGVGTLLVSEVSTRTTQNSALVTALDAMAVNVDTNTAAVLAETTLLADELSAQVTRIDILYAAGGGDGPLDPDYLAAIEVEQEARIAADLALASTLTTHVATVRDEIGDEWQAAVSAETLARSGGDTALATTIDLLEATLETKIGVDIGAAISSERTVRVTAEEALGERIDITQASISTLEGDLTALVGAETIARATEYGVLASAIETAQTTVEGQIASVQTTLETEIGLVDGTVTAIGARWTAVVDVNGLVGGFGIYNDGSTVQAGFNVNTFWVGTTDANKRKPFIISEGVTYINEAVIPTLSADKIDTRGMLLRNTAGAVIFGAGATVDPSVHMVVPSGWLNSNLTPSITAAQNSANSANALLADIASDSKLTPDEKQMIRKEWDAIYAERAGIVSQAASLSVVSTAYTNRMNTLGTYLSGGTSYTASSTPPSWINNTNLSVTTNIVGSTFRSNWASFYTDRQALLNAIDTATSQRAVWANVTGAGRPEDGATVGATLAQANAIAAATTALTNTLNKTGSQILSGTLTTDAVAMSGIRVGNLVWNGTGNRQSGYGVAITPGGLVGYNPAGVQTFGLSATTGALVVKGDISGSTVNAVGGLSVNGATYANTVSGFWTGIDSGLAKLRVGNDVAFMKWTGTELLVQGLVSAGVNNPLPGTTAGAAASVGTAEAFITFNTNGTITATGGNTVNWFKPTTTNIGASHYVRFTRIGGNGSMRYNSTFVSVTPWLQLNALRRVSAINTDNPAPGTTTTYQVVALAEIASDANGTNVLASGPFVMSATKSNGAMEP
jgi:hypothetical protein